MHLFENNGSFFKIHFHLRRRDCWMNDFPLENIVSPGFCRDSTSFPVLANISIAFSIKRICFYQTVHHIIKNIYTSILKPYFIIMSCLLLSIEFFEIVLTSKCLNMCSSVPFYVRDFANTSFESSENTLPSYI
mgnify:CR=1 FL=1